jgi:hypothetical protein
LFNKLSEYPEIEGEKPTESSVSSTTLDTAGPLFNRNYFGTFSDQYIEHNGKKYFHIDPKEVIVPGQKIKYISPKSMGELTITEIINKE